MKNSVIIVSGGMDSITLLYDRKDEIALGISFDYGSNHNAREIPFAKMHCERLGIRHITIVDCDIVCASNVNRQLMATTKTVGRVKVEALKERLLEINPECEVTALHKVYKTH